MVAYVSLNTVMAGQQGKPGPGFWLGQFPWQFSPPHPGTLLGPRVPTPSTLTDSRHPRRRIDMNGFIYYPNGLIITHSQLENFQPFLLDPNNPRDLNRHLLSKPI